MHVIEVYVRFNDTNIGFIVQREAIDDFKIFSKCYSRNNTDLINLEVRKFLFRGFYQFQQILLSLNVFTSIAIHQ